MPDAVETETLNDFCQSSRVEPANPRTRMVHQETAHQVIDVADTGGLDGVRGQQQPGIFYAACRDHCQLGVYLRPHALNRGDFEAVEAGTVRCELDLPHS